MDESTKEIHGKEGENGNGLTRIRWKNRRKMAWVSLLSMVLVTFLLMFGPIPDSRLKILSEPLTWFYFAMASVIGAYMGFTTWADRSGGSSSSVSSRRRY